MRGAISNILKYRIKNTHRKKAKEAHHDFEMFKSGFLSCATMNVLDQMTIC